MAKTFQKSRNVLETRIDKSEHSLFLLFNRMPNPCGIRRMGTGTAGSVPFKLNTWICHYSKFLKYTLARKLWYCLSFVFPLPSSPAQGATFLPSFTQHDVNRGGISPFHLLHKYCRCFLWTRHICSASFLNHSLADCKLSVRLHVGLIRPFDQWHPCVMRGFSISDEKLMKLLSRIRRSSLSWDNFRLLIRGPFDKLVPLPSIYRASTKSESSGRLHIAIWIGLRFNLTKILTVFLYRLLCDCEAQNWFKWRCKVSNAEVQCACSTISHSNDICGELFRIFFLKPPHSSLDYLQVFRKILQQTLSILLLMIAILV